MLRYYTESYRLITLSAYFLQSIITMLFTSLTQCIYMFSNSINKWSVILDMSMDRTELLYQISKVECKAQQGKYNKQKLLSELNELYFEANMKNTMLSDNIKSVLKEVETVLPGTLKIFDLDAI
ncbi:hypothetical protein [Plesiomonas shigelloides]|uniref:hypothetical protein n=1 Tax=Plesiomonas shigelloides TaxID=703 RepID=UPI001C5BC990|nr:hypothetical protein [Plesiomonas shigelloides]MBW3794657.1 hypothetical protein [Plesiomonas shigelloides]